MRVTTEKKAIKLSFPTRHSKMLVLIYCCKLLIFVSNRQNIIRILNKVN